MSPTSVPSDTSEPGFSPMATRFSINHKKLAETLFLKRTVYGESSAECRKTKDIDSQNDDPHIWKRFIVRI